MIYWVLTTPRSGGNYVAGEIWRRLGGNPRVKEFLKPKFVESRINFRADATAPVESYVRFLRDKFGVGGILGIKALYSQMEPFFEYRDFISVLENRKIIYLYRNNIIEQGISYYLAKGTQQWSSSAAQAPAADTAEIPYDFAKIMSWVKKMELHNTLLKRFLLVNNLKYLSACYEDFVADPGGATSRVMQYIGFAPPDDNPVRVGAFEKQSTTKNDEFYRRVVSDARSQFCGDGSFEGGPLFRRPDDSVRQPLATRPRTINRPPGEQEGA
jgi:LPS sulfotransferase NodH